MKALGARLWHSPTLTTWASFATRGLGFVVVLPIVLREFSPGEVALWQVFALLISLQGLADSGFGTTFIRLLAYAMGGATEPGKPRHQDASGGAAPNWQLVGRLAGSMRLIYLRLSWVFAIALLTGGTAALLRRVNDLDPGGNTTRAEAWMAWGVVFVTTLVNFRSSSYAMFLQGTNHVALSRRLEALFGLGSLVSSVAVLWAGGGLVGFVFANQVWFLLAARRNFWLARQILGGRFREFPLPSLDREVFAAVWPAASRSGVGTLMALGLVQVSGIVVAQGRDTLTVASYLLGLRLIQTVSLISQAPFYSKVPLMARLWAERKRESLIALAGRGMAWSLWAFVLPAIVLGFAGPRLLLEVGSQTPFPHPRLWALFVAAFLVERYGGMHIQLFSLTNRIVWHVANGVSGLISLITMAVFCPRWGVIGVPVGLLTGYLGFYAWYSALKSYREYRMPFWRFELRTTLGPSMALLFATIWILGSSLTE